MTMEVKLFTDLVNALGTVATKLKSIIDLPKAEREKIRQTLDETYRLIDTTLNMVIIRLGDVLLQSTDERFLAEAARLDNYHEWMQAEREFRLCRSLRVALREMETLAGRLTGAVSTKDWDALSQQMQAILATEGEVAVFISGHLQELASEARSAAQDAQRSRSVRDALAALRASLVSERQELIQQELALYDFV